MNMKKTKATEKKYGYEKQEKQAEKGFKTIRDLPFTYLGAPVFRLAGSGPCQVPR